MARRPNLKNLLDADQTWDAVQRWLVQFLNFYSVFRDLSQHAIWTGNWRFSEVTWFKFFKVLGHFKLHLHTLSYIPNLPFHLQRIWSGGGGPEGGGGNMNGRACRMREGGLVEDSVSENVPWKEHFTICYHL